MRRKLKVHHTGQPWFYKKAAKELQPLTKQDYLDFEKDLNYSIGVSGALLTYFIIDHMKHKDFFSKLNRRSHRLFMKWVMSEARAYRNLGTSNPNLNEICKRWCKIKLENIVEKEHEAAKEQETKSE